MEYLSNVGFAGVGAKGIKRVKKSSKINENSTTMHVAIEAKKYRDIL